MLREAAQCTPEDEEAFQDVQKHMYLNTNNLWLRLDKLKEAITKNKGFLPLPMIKNAKTIDPKDASSTPVVQLETAMGAAIECFPGASAAVRNQMDVILEQLPTSKLVLASVFKLPNSLLFFVPEECFFRFFFFPALSSFQFACMFTLFALMSTRTHYA